MPNAYENPAAANAFSGFVESEDGRIQRDLLYNSIRPYLKNKDGAILDAACGQGWLAARLLPDFPHISAFDSSATLIAEAKQKYPAAIDFQVLDATGQLPYPNDSFDTVILNMAAHDLHDLSAGFKNLHRITKPGGTFIMTIANPYYSFPVGVWKRGLSGFLLRKKPSLKVRAYHEFRRQGSKLFNWKGAMSSYFYPLSEYMNAALGSGFALQKMEDLSLETDSQKFNAQHQLHRFPLILLFVFEKRGK